MTERHGMPTKEDPDRWARLRFAIIGPLLAAPPPRGTLRGELEALAQKNWRHPVNGTAVRFSFATLERWYYAARHVSRIRSSRCVVMYVMMPVLSGNSLRR